jgi:hypothetical protein
MGSSKRLPEFCTVDGCDRKYRARGLCGTHYYRQRAGTPLDGDERSEGEKHRNAKLASANVRELRSLYADGATLRQLAEKFGVSNVSIYNAVAGKTWRHLQ